ncbi:Uncharacterised protein [Salmonella enterica subsp. enterica serovar Typhi]|nr:Uncharacterised protein [Salmonella enterica subsp. enterica serovar Typhi]
MQYFCAEGCHLRRFFKVDFINSLRDGHYARVGGVNTGHICPDINPRGVERFSQQRCRIVAAAAA